MVFLISLIFKFNTVSKRETKRSIDKNKFGFTEIQQINYNLKDFSVKMLSAYSTFMLLSSSNQY
jgi:hypothetical protein